MAKLRLLKGARRDIEAIERYSRDTFGWDVAEKYLTSFDDAFATLRNFPHAGQTVTRSRGGYRVFTCRQHRLFYRTDDAGDVVTIVRILHHAQNGLAHLD